MPTSKSKHENDSLPRHSQILRLGRVHVALGYSLANSAAIEVPGGYVVVDTLPSLRVARELRAEFDHRIPGNVVAIVYTHSHTDHIRGTAAFAASGVPVWAQEGFFEELQNTYRLSRSAYRRGARQFGYGLPPDEVENCGIGPPLEMDDGPAPPVVVPTHTFRDQAEIEFGDVRIELHAAPGETPDQLFAWLPEDRILLAADNIYRAFPNLYAIRGVRPRPIEQWIDSLDRMRHLDPAPEVMVLGHTEPVEGAQRIHELLTVYRDAIAFVHDSVVRLINEERTPDEMVRTIQLPAHLREHPYLQEVYGTLPGAIRGIYAGYIGWFDGASVSLEPIHPAEVGARLAKMAGGAANLIQTIEAALDDGDFQWATWLSDRLLASAPRHHAAEQLKSRGLKALAEQTGNPLLRHWYLSEAAELVGQLNLPSKPAFDRHTIAQIPIECMMRMMPQRLDPVKSAQVTSTFAFEFLDSGKQFTFIVRRGVGELVQRLIDAPDLLLRLTEEDFKRLMVAREVSRLSPEYWRSIELVVPEAGVLAPFRKLRRLALFGRIMQRP